MTRHLLSTTLLVGLALTGLACMQSSRETNPATSSGESAAAPTAAPAADSAVRAAPSDAAPVIGADVGNIAPDFTLTAPDGSSFTLSEARGRPVALVFFRGTW